MASTAKKPTGKSASSSTAKPTTGKTATPAGRADVPSEASAVAAAPGAGKTVKAPAPSSRKTPAKSAPAPADAIPRNDAELLAMPESAYMNEAQLAYFKAKLIAMRDEILQNARETGEHLKENEVFADPNDRATVEEENLLEQRVRDRERKLLKKINASLARIEEGEYGYCLETGEPIGLPRLLARPTAELSIEAQEKHERMEKLYAD